MKEKKRGEEKDGEFSQQTLRELSTYVALCYLPSDHRAKFRRAGYEIASLSRARARQRNYQKSSKKTEKPSAATPRRCVSAILARRPLTRGHAGTNMKPSAMHGDASSGTRETKKRRKKTKGVRERKGKDDTVALST